MKNIGTNGYYKFKFYLNASHSIYINGNQGKKHPHTWEITMHMLKMKNEFIEFSYIETQIEEVLFVYQDKFLNDIQPFNTINPTLENIAIYLKDEICNLLNRENWILLYFEVSETPTRSYIINLKKEQFDFSANDKSVQERRCFEYVKQRQHVAEDIADNIIKSVLEKEK
jgi:6-pyruvoyltetrahydropterin/6-carboxytetrahydropterin synthase